MKQRELIHDNLRDTHWIGEVVDNADPLAKGRCRIKVFGKFDKLPTEAIPWASPMVRTGVGVHVVPNLNDIVAVRFDNGDLYHPEYWFQVDQNKELQDEVLLNSETPHDVISLIYDANRKFRLYFSPEDGLVITTGDSNTAAPMLRFDPDGKIFIHSEEIYIATTDGADDDEPAVRGNTLAELLSNIIDQFNAHTHPTGVGPSGPPLPPQLPNMISLKAKIGSNSQEGFIQQKL